MFMRRRFQAKRKNEFKDEEASKILRVAIKTSEKFHGGGDQRINNKDGAFRKMLRCNASQYNPTEFVQYLSVIAESFGTDISKGDITQERAAALNQAINYYHKNAEAINKKLSSEEFIKLIGAFESLHRGAFYKRHDISNFSLNEIGKSLKKALLFAESHFAAKNSLENVTTETKSDCLSALIYPLNSPDLKHVSSLTMNTKKAALSAFFKFTSNLDIEFINGIKDQDLGRIIQRIEIALGYVQKNRKEIDLVLDTNEVKRLLEDIKARKDAIEFDKLEKEKQKKEAQQKQNNSQDKDQNQDTNLTSEQIAEEIERKLLEAEGKKQKEKKEAEDKKALDLEKDQERFKGGQPIAKFEIRQGEYITLTHAQKKSVADDWLEAPVMRMECLKINGAENDHGFYIEDTTQIEIYGAGADSLSEETKIESTSVEQLAQASVSEDKVDVQEVITDEEQTTIAKQQKIDAEAKQKLEEGRKEIQKKIAGKKILAFPMHLGNHWVTVFIDLRKPKDPKIIYCGSKPGYELAAKEKIGKVIRWLDIKPEASRSIFKSTDVKNQVEGIQFINQQIPQQPNDEDCGLYTIKTLQEAHRLFLEDPNFKFTRLGDMTVDAPTMRLDITEGIEILQTQYEPLPWEHAISPNTREKIAKAGSSNEITINRKQITTTPLVQPTNIVVSHIENGYIYGHPDYIKPVQGGRRFGYIGDVAEIRKAEDHPLEIEDFPTCFIPIKDKGRVEDLNRGLKADLSHISIGDTLEVTMQGKNGHPGTVAVKVLFSRRAKAGDAIRDPIDVRQDNMGKEYIRFRTFDPTEPSGNEQTKASSDKEKTVALYEEDFEEVCKNLGKTYMDVVAIARIPPSERDDYQKRFVTLRTLVPIGKTKDDLKTRKKEQGHHGKLGRTSSF